jgi:high affinity Mn2+ porin
MRQVVPITGPLLLLLLAGCSAFPPSPDAHDPPADTQLTTQPAATSRTGERVWPNDYLTITPPAPPSAKSSVSPAGNWANSADNTNGGKDDGKNGNGKDNGSKQPAPGGSAGGQPGAPKSTKNSDTTSGDGKGKDNGNGKDEQEDKDKDKDKDNDKDKRKLLPEGWNFHAQTTLIPNFTAGFGALYSGPNSLSTQAQRVGTITSDLFLGAPLWHGAEFHSDLLVWQGFGLSNSFGLENFSDVDAFKSGTVDPRYMMSHFFVRQTFGLGGEQEDVPDGFFTLSGKRDVSRITLTVGRLSMPDIFDYNTYNHDGHTQFMSWGSTMLPWDYASDTNGFTTGIAIELNQKDWAVRYGWFQMPGTPNGLTADDRIFTWPIEPGERTTNGEFWKSWGMMLEFERRWHIEEHPGAIRLQTWVANGRWASYHEATTLLLASPPDPNIPAGVQSNVPAAAFAYHSKYGFGVNWEQEITKTVGVFGRAGWQDGQTAAAAYNDSNWAAQLGLSVKGAAWHRPGDTFGLCGNVAGISSAQQAFLKAGGLGIQNGDGNLSYAPETSFETYYDIALAKSTHLAFDYQFYANPAFNHARGPVNVFLARLHWEY